MHAGRRPDIGLTLHIRMIPDAPGVRATYNRRRYKFGRMYRVLGYTRVWRGGVSSDQHRPWAVIPDLAQHPKARRSDPHTICDNTCWPPWSGDQRWILCGFPLDHPHYSPWMFFGRSDGTKRPGSSHPLPSIPKVNKLLSRFILLIST